MRVPSLCQRRYRLSRPKSVTILPRRCHPPRPCLLRTSNVKEPHSFFLSLVTGYENLTFVPSPSSLVMLYRSHPGRWQSFYAAFSSRPMHKGCLSKQGRYVRLVSLGSDHHLSAYMPESSFMGSSKHGGHGTWTCTRHLNLEDSCLFCGGEELLAHRSSARRGICLPPQWALVRMVESSSHRTPAGCEMDSNG